MRPPGFWQEEGWAAAVLGPVGKVVAWSTARRLRRPGWRAPVPVLCCGNVGMGGAGKTTLVLDLAARLVARGVAVHCLTRGYGGQARGPLRVDPARHDARLTGDEPLLLAAIAPTWVGGDRAASARLAVAAGAEVLLMDDGLQNPGLVQDAGILVIDGAAGFGNGRVVPAGPLREPVSQAAARCRAAVLIGADRHDAAACLPPDLPVLRASLVPDRALHGQRVVAFAGIARPGKFYGTIEDAGGVLAGTVDFPDHHRFTAAELARVMARAEAAGATVLTTPKDAVRLDAAWRSRVETLGVSLAWTDEQVVGNALEGWVQPGAQRGRAAGSQ